MKLIKYGNKLYSKLLKSKQANPNFHYLCKKFRYRVVKDMKDSKSSYFKQYFSLNKHNKSCGLQVQAAAIHEAFYIANKNLGRSFQLIPNPSFTISACPFQLDSLSHRSQSLGSLNFRPSFGPI